jgi:hypothetical protein
MRGILNSTGTPPSLYSVYKYLLNFIDDVLCDFRPLSITEKGNIVDSEDDITQDLVRYLNDRQEFPKQKVNYPFYFENQSKQGNKKVDIGVRCGRRYTATNNILMCWIEAKRLPTPKGRNRDEREYVFVSQENTVNKKRKFDGNGGIQRFKEGEYASKLDRSIMIGYKQDNNTEEYWLLKINGWIADLANTDSGFWSNEDCLNKHNSNKCSRFVSVHKRKDESTIELHHFWIELSS